jgi:hypothetical protein
MKPKNWPEYFEAIEKRPGMFLGLPSIVSLQFEIQGIRLAEDWYAIPEEERIHGFSFRDFEAWVERTYNLKRLSIQSYTLAQYLSCSNREKFLISGMQNDSEEAFRLWFTWYHEFINFNIKKSTNSK